MSHPIKAADTGSVPSPEHNYRCLRTELAEQLVSIFRIMFPHDTLPDEFYQHVIRKLDEKVAKDADLMRLVSEGVDALNDQTGFAWKSLPSETKLQCAIFTHLRPRTQHLPILNNASKLCMFN